MIRARVKDERGQALIIMALVVAVLFGMAAVALDVSQRRTDRRVNKTIADFATTAGANGLRVSPWSGVCDAIDYLVANESEFASFATQDWRDGNNAALAGGNPCSNTTTTPFTTQCNPAVPASWARFHGTAAGGRIDVRVESAYSLPDPTYREDTVPVNDNGSPCLQVAVIISESRKPGFAGAFDAVGKTGTGNGQSRTTQIRSVGRLAPGGPALDPASLVLLERNDCGVVTTGGSNTRIIVSSKPAAGPDPAISGIIQADSDATGGSCGGANSFILEGASTSGGPSIVAKNAVDGMGNIQKLARIGIFAELLGSAKAHSAWPSSIGEPDPVGWPQIGRGQVDRDFLANMTQLDTDATALVNMATLPTGFTDATGAAPGLNLGCTINTATPIAAPTPSKLWFNCPGGLTVNQLTITVPDAEIVVNGPVRVNSPGLTISDARKVWIKGTSSGGNPTGADVRGPLSVNAGGFASCALRFASAPSARTKIGTFFVKEGRINLSSGAQLKLCQSMMYLRGGTSTSLPASAVPEGTLSPGPVNLPSNEGLLNVTSGTPVDWSAPNELDTRPTAADFLIHKFEDLALWTEASKESDLTGGGALALSGIFFLGNANPFKISGNGSSNIDLDAQFWTRKLVVTGGSTLTMIPNPSNQVPIESMKIALVR